MTALKVSEWVGPSLRCTILLTALMLIAYASGIAAMVAPFCATCALLAVLPKAPFSTPRTIFLSHLICIGIGAGISLGMTATALSLPVLLVVLISTWLSIMTMAGLRVAHAPAVAHTAILALGQQKVEVYVACAMVVAVGFAVFAYFSSIISHGKKIPA